MSKSFIDFILPEDYERYNELLSMAEEAKANAAYNRGDIESSDIRAEDKKKIKNDVTNNIIDENECKTFYYIGANNQKERKN